MGEIKKDASGADVLCKLLFENEKINTFLPGYAEKALASAKDDPLRAVDLLSEILKHLAENPIWFATEEQIVAYENLHKRWHARQKEIIDTLTPVDDGAYSVEDAKAKGFPFTLEEYRMQQEHASES